MLAPPPHTHTARWAACCNVAATSVRTTKTGGARVGLMNVEICAYTRTRTHGRNYRTEINVRISGRAKMSTMPRADIEHAFIYCATYTRMHGDVSFLALLSIWSSRWCPLPPFVCAYADAVVVMMHFYQTTCFFVVIVCNQKKIVFFRSASNVYLTHAHTHMHARTQIHTHAKWKR